MKKLKTECTIMVINQKIQVHWKINKWQQIQNTVDETRTSFLGLKKNLQQIPSTFINGNW